MRLLIPACNEESTVGLVLDKALELDVPVTVLCNGCTDSTAEIAQSRMGTKSGTNHIFAYPNKLGIVGTAQQGINEYPDEDFFVFCDSDFEVNPLEVKKVLKEHKENPNADIILGCRDRALIPRESEKVVADLFNLPDVLSSIRLFSRSSIEAGYGFSHPIIRNGILGRGVPLTVPIELNVDRLRHSTNTNDDDIYLTCAEEILELIRICPEAKRIYSPKDLFRDMFGG